MYTVVTRRWLATADSTTQVVSAQQAHALLFALLAVVAAWVVAGGAVMPGNGSVGVSAAVSAAGWASAIASGVLYYGLAYWFYLSGLRDVQASFAAVSFYLIPIFGVAGGFLLLGERLEPSQWAGAVVVLGALYLIVRGPAARASVEARI